MNAPLRIKPRLPFSRRSQHAHLLAGAAHVRRELLPLTIELVGTERLPPSSRRALIRIHTQYLRDAWHERHRLDPYWKDLPG